MDYYKRYMGDYGRDTSRLSMMEHGAYNLLLDDYYSTRTPLPADLDELYRICRATTVAEQKAVASVANRFFPPSKDGFRHNHRADEEIAKWEDFAEQNREKGKLGGRPKKHRSENPQGNPTGSCGDNPNGTQRETQRVSLGLGKTPVLETRTETPPIPNPNPNPESRILSLRESQSARAHLGEALGNGNGAGSEGKDRPAAGDAWRDVTECDPEAYEAWLAYRRAENDSVPDLVRLSHAKWLGGIQPVERQRELVATCIRLRFKQLRDPNVGGRFPGSNGNGITHAPLKSAEQLEAEALARGEDIWAQKT